MYFYQANTKLVFYILLCMLFKKNAFLYIKSIQIYKLYISWVRKEKAIIKYSKILLKRLKSYIKILNSHIKYQNLQLKKNGCAFCWFTSIKST